MRNLTSGEMEQVSGCGFLAELGKAILIEGIIEGGKKLASAMNEHAETCGIVIHDDPAGRGRALL